MCRCNTSGEHPAAAGVNAGGDGAWAAAPHDDSAARAGRAAATSRSMGCTEALAATALIAALALIAGFGMLLRPRDVLAVGDWYFSRIGRKMHAPEEREKIQQLRLRLDKRTREVRIGGGFYLLLSLPFLLVLAQVTPRMLASTMPGC
jgi:hypothetical protein